MLFSGNEWIKVFSHDSTGGVFANADDALRKNAEDPDALLYSVLDQLEKYRSKIGFHFKLCYPEFANGGGQDQGFHWFKLKMLVCLKFPIVVR